MLVVALLQFLGLVALGFLVTPLMFYLIGMATSLIVLTVNLSLKLSRQKSLNSFPKVFKKPSKGCV